MILLSLIILLLAAGSKVLAESEDGSAVIGNIGMAIIETIAAVVELIAITISNIVREIRHPPANQNSSIQYLLFTPESPEEPCYLEPNLKMVNQCSFDTSYPMKFIIHGFGTDLKNDSPHWQVKNQMLKLYDFNVIIVNWTSYNQLPFILACANTVTIGWFIAEFIQFLQNNTGLEAKNIHLIGHSLGAHMAGAAGRHIPNLERITGLDPAGPLYFPFEIFPALSYKDANFVDVIHTSNIITGFGHPNPLGDMDFFPNGGPRQPQCLTLGPNFTGPESLYTGTCNHQASIIYFLESLNTRDCTFPSTMCNNYTDFLDGLCSNDSFPMVKMGLPAKPILGLAPKSKFYLQTPVYEPYCVRGGYKPIYSMQLEEEYI